MDKNSKGFQILREYVNYYGFNFCGACATFDPDARQMIRKADFRNALISTKNEFFFTAEDIEEIITDAPHHFDGTDYFVLYVDLYN